MKIWQFVVAGLLGLALAGCRNDPSVALLERDNRKKEREIHRLHKRVEDLEEALNGGAPAGPAILRGVPPEKCRPSPARSRAAGQARPAPAPRRRSPRQDEAIPSPRRLFRADSDISPGTPAPPGEVPERMRVPGNGVPPRQVSPPGGSPSGGSSQWSPAGGQTLAGHSALTDNSPVAQITLHPALTGGIGTGVRSGDEGLLVVVEPRDFGGNIVNAPGEISVALLDPALSGEQARLARWDFAAAQTRGHDPHRLATRDSPAIALGFHAGPRPAEGLCPLYDPRRPETPGRAADCGRREWSAAGSARGPLRCRRRTDRLPPATPAMVAGEIKRSPFLHLLEISDILREEGRGAHAAVG